MTRTRIEAEVDTKLRDRVDAYRSDLGNMSRGAVVRLALDKLLAQNDKK